MNKSMVPITCVGMTCFSCCSLVTLKLGQSTGHNEHCRDCLMYTAFSVVDPKMDPVFIPNFMLYAKNLYTYLFFSIASSLSENLFMHCDCKTLFFMLIVKHFFVCAYCKAYVSLCKKSSFFLAIFCLCLPLHILKLLEE